MPKLEHDLLGIPLKLIILLLWIVTFFLTACAGGMQSGNVPSVQRYAITHVNLVPMTQEIILEDQTVLIDGSRSLPSDRRVKPISPPKPSPSMEPVIT